jgi:hypothetical protein
MFRSSLSKKGINTPLPGHFGRGSGLLDKEAYTIAMKGALRKSSLDNVKKIAKAAGVKVKKFSTLLAIKKKDLREDFKLLKKSGNLKGTVDSNMRKVARSERREHAELKMKEKQALRTAYNKNEYLYGRFRKSKLSPGAEEERKNITNRERNIYKSKYGIRWYESRKRQGDIDALIEELKKSPDQSLEAQKEKNRLIMMKKDRERAAQRYVKDRMVKAKPQPELKKQQEPKVLKNQVGRRQIEATASTDEQPSATIKPTSAPIGVSAVPSGGVESLEKMGMDKMTQEPFGIAQYSRKNSIAKETNLVTPTKNIDTGVQSNSAGNREIQVGMFNETGEVELSTINDGGDRQKVINNQDIEGKKNNVIDFKEKIKQRNKNRKAEKDEPSLPSAVNF